MGIEVTYVDHMGTDLTVANAARVSFGKKSEMDSSDPWGPPFLKVKDAKLIRYLAEHKHISPFGHCFASFHIKAPLFVARQLVKHKFLRWNEVSRRYVDNEPEFYNPAEWRGRSDDKKQGSEGVVLGLDIGDINTMCKETYNRLLSKGVCPEQARMVLPQSMMTEWYWSGSLDAFADMCKLRYADDTQAETREVAEYIAGEMYELFPVSWEALVEIEHER
jgi:thymidylate synthase (FAD)